MSELVSRDTTRTKTMLVSWTAESKEMHRFPAVFLPAFYKAGGSMEPIRCSAWSSAPVQCTEMQATAGWG